MSKLIALAAGIILAATIHLNFEIYGGAPGRQTAQNQGILATFIMPAQKTGHCVGIEWIGTPGPFIDVDC